MRMIVWTFVQVFTLTGAFYLANVKALESVHWTVEAPGVQHSTANFDYMGTANFDSVEPGFYETITRDFGFPDKAITATYYNVTLAPTDRYGGAEKNLVYPKAYGGVPYTVKFKKTGARGINYFGYWVSALDEGNQLEFYFESESVFNFTAADVLQLIGDNTGYYGNPNSPDHANSAEAYAFINFFLLDGALIDEIHFVELGEQDGSESFESDSHTVGYYREIPSPEPPTKTKPHPGSTTKPLKTQPDETPPATVEAPPSGHCTKIATCEECLAGGCRWCQRNEYTPGVCASLCYGAVEVSQCPKTT